MVIRVQHLEQISAALKIRFQAELLEHEIMRFPLMNHASNNLFTCNSFSHHRNLSCRYQTPAPSPEPGRLLTSQCCVGWAVGDRGNVRNGHTSNRHAMKGRDMQTHPVTIYSSNIKLVWGHLVYLLLQLIL